MSDMQLDGLYSREAEIGQEDYHLFQLTSTNLTRLAASIYRHSETHSWQVNIGYGRLCFEIVPHNSFTAEALDSGGVLLRTSPSDLKRLASQLQEMARAEKAPDYLVHIHLDTYFTTSGKGLSDVIFQRMEEFHGEA